MVTSSPIAMPPPPPEIEGYLKKLKRKTSNLSSSWNKRWFFVDPKRKEFGYAKSKSPNATRSSIYLNDITAVVQFDDTHFQIESRTRNFFLCGENKASTTSWVKALEEYRRKQAQYEKDKAVVLLNKNEEVEKSPRSIYDASGSDNKKKISIDPKEVSSLHFSNEQNSRKSLGKNNIRKTPIQAWGGAE